MLVERTGEMSPCHKMASQAKLGVVAQSELSFLLHLLQFYDLLSFPLCYDEH